MGHCPPVLSGLLLYSNQKTLSMCKYIFLYTFLLLQWGLPLQGFSQGSVSTAIIPAIGDSIHLVNCTSIDFQEGASGPNQNWDFSGLSPDPTEPNYFFKFLDPQQTPYPTQYPQAFLAAVNPDSQYVYYQLDNNVLQLVGAVAEEPSLGTAFANYENAETEEVFPISYENTWSDDFDGNNVAGPFSVAFSGTINGEVDAFGTLTLPSGTFTNVLRIKEERSYSIPGAPLATSMMYRYVSADHYLWLLSMESFPTGPPIIYYQDMPAVVSTKQALDFSKDIQLHPNPISAGQVLQLQTESQTLEALYLYSVSGKQEALEILQDGRSGVRAILPEALSPGIYSLQGILEDGFFVKKIYVVDRD